MPRDLFGSVTNPSARRAPRAWSTVLLSLAAHVAALVTVVVVPLMATGVLPTPKSTAMVMAMLPPPLPAPPPAPRPARTPPQAARDAAPVESPQGIAPEPEFDPGFEDRSNEPVGIVSGIPDHIEIEPPPPPPVAKPAPPPVRPGGLIKVPEKINDVPPVYPPLAVTVRKEGVVILEATIGIDGRVVSARILRSEPLLDQAAVDAVSQWIYTPTTLNGVPVPVLMTVTVRFQLRR